MALQVRIKLKEKENSSAGQKAFTIDGEGVKKHSINGYTRSNIAGTVTDW